jgi:DNA-binding response OmpR family regulator
MAKRILLQSGYIVLEASNGLQGVAVAASHPGPIDLVMTDLVMPKLSGVEMAERLTAVRPGLRVLFTSGYSEESILHEGPDASANFLRKPFSIGDLTKKVREILDRS